ncbi:MAG TPA: hypothetical protein VF069_01030 [Streptosporangiaceae bacterium]
MTRSQGRLKEQVQEAVREIPAQAARLALFGVGRTLLLTDRVRKDVREARESGVRPLLERWRGDAGQLAGKVMGRVGARLPRTGRATSEPGTPEPEPPVATPPEATPPEATPPKGRAGTADAVLDAEPVAEPAPAPVPEPPAESGAEPVAKPSPEPAPAPKPPAPKAAKGSGRSGRSGKVAADSLPVPDYDDATLASVRARLRTLTAAQVSQLRDYEAAHAARPDFLRMYENRIAKLTSGS